MSCKFAFYTGSLSYDRKERGTNYVRNIVFMDFSWLYPTSCSNSSNGVNGSDFSKENFDKKRLFNQAQSKVRHAT